MPSHYGSECPRIIALQHTLLICPHVCHIVGCIAFDGDVEVWFSPVYLCCRDLSDGHGVENRLNRYTQ